MNLYILFYLFDIKKVFYNKPIENKIKYYNHFYKLLYNESKYTIQSLLLWIPNDYIILEQDNHILINDHGMKKIVQIEESILNNINIVLNKKIELSIYNECRKKKYLLENNQCNLILRISGIWESYDKIGITYKFILQ
jgi:hypothetical protein